MKVLGLTMLSCDQFRHRVGAAPRRLGWPERLHALMCQACSGFLREMRALEGLIESALAIDFTPMAEKVLASVKKPESE